MIQVIPSMIPHILDLLEVHLGLNDKTKTDELLEKFQTPVDPPSFTENHVAILFWKSRSKKPV